ncbi:MAG TPA: VOC family protein [Burkholderiaceae bacterium]|uniref:VOC family protein n=1 Tax=Pusillimonas sp. TaxID=3040095 RepID=UPI002B54BBCC|nr:VOC family protein [Burkholderiaceae bacterium]
MSRPGLTFSHIGIFVYDIPLMEDFYTRLLEFTVTDRGELETPNGAVSLVFMSRDPDEHHQIVLVSGRPPQLEFNVINQISLKADSLGTLRLMYQRMIEYGANDIQPATHGNAISVYVRDPEGNRLELYLDLPWYVNQPFRMPVDLSLDDDALMASLERHARSLPGFRTRSEWRAEVARKMGIAQEDS